MCARNSCLKGLLTVVLLFATTLVSAAQTVTVYKDASCGCCGAWVDHLKANGFAR